MRDREPDSHLSTRKIPVGSLHLDLLGTFCLRREGQPVTGLEHPRLQQLLAYLALHRSAPISRQQLAFLFWPESTDQQALKNLRTILTRLRRALPDMDPFINISSQTIQWRSNAPFSLDADEFETAIARAVGAHGAGDYSGTANALVTAVTIYTGDLLPGCYDDWILPLREQLHQAFLDALERLVLLLEEHRSYRNALPYARRLLNLDPLHEAAYHHLIRLNLALGDRAEAARICRACETMLETEFGTTLASGMHERYEHLFEEEWTGQGVIEGQRGTRTANPPLVGRDTEWFSLLAAWRAAAKGHPQMVLISGEAGIGKTRLAEELCGWIARQGADVAVARCYPAGGVPLAYAPVIEWLRDKNLQSRLVSLDDIWTIEISRIFPTILTNHPHLKSPGPFTGAWQRARLFEALARAVLGPDENAPVLLFLDDLQWCDQETLDWLGYLLRFAPHAPILVVAAVRKYEIDRVHPLMAFWFALTRSGLLTEIALAPLDAAETALLAANAAGREVSAGEAARIYQDTEGNPLFVVETVQAGRSNEGMDGEGNPPAPDTAEELVGERPKEGMVSLPYLPAPAAFPPRVRAVIQWRLAQLSPCARALVETAAVIGRKFHYQVLARASGMDEESVVEGLEELWQRHIVRAQGGPDYDFSHDGFRAVAYDETGPFRRRAAHLRVAQTLEALHQDDLDASSIQIAGHYEEAGQAQEAIAFYRRAASAAERVYANAAAARLYQHLLEGELSEGLPRAEKCSLMLSLAEVWRATGQWAQAESISREALVEADALGDIHLQARAKSALADVLRRLGYYGAALQWLAEAEQTFQAAGDFRGAAGTLRILGEIHWFRGDHAQALAAFERQLEMASGMDDLHGICSAGEAVGMVLWSQGELERAAYHCLRSIRLATPLEYKPVLMRASITLGNIRSSEHWFGEAVYWFQHAGTLAREMDDRQALSWAVYSIAQILAKRGEFERAMAGFVRSLRGAWEIGDRWTSCLNIASLAAVYDRLGRADEAGPLYRLAVRFGESLNIPGYLSGMLTGLARFLLAQGRAGEAHAIYEEALNRMASVAGERLAGEDPRFEAQVLGIRLRHAMSSLSAAEAVAEIRALLAWVDAPSQRSALLYEIWRLAPEDEAARFTAAELSRTEFEETWAESCRERYRELTGDSLPDPPPLPDVSDLIPDQKENMDLEPMLGQMRALFS